jgi:hypothetical protein
VCPSFLIAPAFILCHFDAFKSKLHEKRVIKIAKVKTVAGKEKEKEGKN